MSKTPDAQLPYHSPAPASAGTWQVSAWQNRAENLQAQFPLPLRDTELVLLDIDPHRLHLYWHISAQDYQGRQLRLRLHSEASSQMQEIDLTGAQGQIYLQSLDSGVRYQARLEQREADQWHELAHSNTIVLPDTLPQLAYAFPPFTPTPRFATRAQDTPATLGLLPEFPNLDRLRDAPTAVLPTQTPNLQQQRIDAIQLIQNRRSAGHLPVQLTAPAPTQAPAAAQLSPPSSLALETFLGISSTRFPADLALHAELRISGTAPLATQVSVFGKALVQDAQGRFQLRQPVAVQQALLLLQKAGDL